MDARCKTLTVMFLMIITALSVFCYIDLDEAEAQTDYDFIEGDLKYKINSDNETVTVVGWDTTQPNSLNIDTVKHDSKTYTITIIGEHAFENCKSLNQINLSDSVTYINYQAFSGCVSIVTISLPASVHLASKAFEKCGGIRDVIIPPTVNDFPLDAFDGCTFYEKNGIDEITDMSKIKGFKYHGESCDVLKKTDEHHIKYNENGGSVHVQDYWTANNSIRVADYNGELADFVFSGWDDGIRVYSPRDVYTVTSNVEFTAVWKPVPTYTMSFDLNGATGITPLSFTKKEGESFNLPSCSATKAGYEFNGWNDGNRTYNVGDSYTVKKSDVRFTAKWSAIPHHTVVYDANGGSAKEPTQSKVMEGTMIYIANYEGTRESYTFGGWSDGKNTYAPGDIYTVNKDVIFTAVWNEIPTKLVKYDVDGGSEHKNSQLVQEWTIFYLEDYKGIKSGYSFGGWSDGNAVYQPGDKYQMGDKDLTFKAVWIADEPSPIKSSLIYIVLLAIAIIVILFLVLRILPRR